MLGVQANAGQSAYGATKAGVNILANVAHRELADQGIRTIALAPSLTDTPGMRASVDEAYVARIAAGYPGGRLGRPARDRSPICNARHSPFRCKRICGPNVAEFRFSASASRPNLRRIAE